MKVQHLYILRQAAIDKTSGEGPLFKPELGRLHKARSPDSTEQINESTESKSRLGTNISIKSRFRIPESLRRPSPAGCIHMIVWTKEADWIVGAGRFHTRT